MTGKATRKQLSFGDKRSILKQKDDNPSITNKELALQWGCSHSAIGKIFKERDFLTSVHCADGRCRNRKSKFSELDMPMYVWYTNAMDTGKKITEQMMMNKAAELLPLLNIEVPDEKTLSKYVQGFHRRYSLAFPTQEGEIDSAPVALAPEGEQITELTNEEILYLVCAHPSQLMNFAEDSAASLFFSSVGRSESGVTGSPVAAQSVDFDGQNLLYPQVDVDVDVSSPTLSSLRKAKQAAETALAETLKFPHIPAVEDAAKCAKQLLECIELAEIGMQEAKIKASNSSTSQDHSPGR